MSAARYVLAQLTRSGIWCTWLAPDQVRARLGRHIILDADSIVTFLYRQCAIRHTRRAARATPATTSASYYATSLVNYQEFGQLVERLLDVLVKELTLTPIVVYHGLLRRDAREQVSEALDACQSHEATTTQQHQLELLLESSVTRPNLSLNVFKQIVNNYHNGTNGSSSSSRIKTHQAFYSPFSSMAKLARDLQCPVLSNEGDFILMDVRAGFILFEDFYGALMRDDARTTLQQPQPHNTLTPVSSTSSGSSSASLGSNASISSKASSSSSSPRAKSGTSSAASLKSLKSSSQVKQTSSARSTTSLGSTQQKPSSARKLKMHQHRLFLRQHPGLNSARSLQLFPLTAGEYVGAYAKSLVRMRLYDRELVSSRQQQQQRPISLAGKVYHVAAGRLESAMRYLCSRYGEILPNLLRSEASRLSSTAIVDDHRELYGYHAIAYDFRGHLRTLLRGSSKNLNKELLEPAQLTHIQTALLEHECTSDFWLALLLSGTPSAACLAPIADFNRSAHFEDLKTRNSARSLLDRPKSLVLSVIFGGRAAPKLKVVDRQGHQVSERTLTCSKQAEQVVKRVTLAQIGRRALDGKDASAFMNLVFNARDLTRLESPKLEKMLTRWQPGSGASHGGNNGGASEVSGARTSAADHGHNQSQLAVLMALHKFSLEQAALGDQQFKQVYSLLSHHFEIGLVNHHVYLAYQQLTKLTSGVSSVGGGVGGGVNSVQANYECSVLAKELKQLINLISSHSLDSLANVSGFPDVDSSTTQVVSRVHPRSPAKRSARSPRAQSPASVESATGGGGGGGAGGPMRQSNDASELRKQVRHLIELFNGSLEAYCELNAFLNDPMPRLQLGTCYNPILLYNLILFSCERPINTKLIKF